MVMSWIWTVLVAISVLGALLTGNSSQLGAAVAEGAQSGLTLAISLAGSICLWTGVGKVMQQSGITNFLSHLLKPILGRIFPTYKRDMQARFYLSTNVCANLLGLGNAATPMGIQAARTLAKGSDAANDELCRLIVLNSASIQLIPANVAAIRTALGCATPFDILPSVWLTSLTSALIGLLSAYLLGKVWRK